ncbi:cilia- and flagella-associated protein HOATZ-like [Littorina saxatilis]|uniref:Cilia- and flagella-associated protein HOATZ n=1 Tax=Littorina saxatilis TaxID=31220 RepID=A0AAN9GFE2_9CAEN
MALKTVDLTQQPHRAVFTGCSQEEVSYAKTFWQSFQLLPPMESRLVSSDIKQRLRKAPPSRSMSNYTSRRTNSGESHLRDFFVRAKTMENIEEFKRLRMFASAREEDRELLHKHRAQRMKREEISRRASSYSAGSGNLTSQSGLSAFSRFDQDEDELMLDDMWKVDVKEEISNFEKMKKLDDPDSDEEK